MIPAFQSVAHQVGVFKMCARLPTILFFNSFCGSPPDISELPVGHRAAFTVDVGRFKSADAVVFHVPDLQDISTLPKRAGQIWIAWSLESVISYPILEDPDFLKRIDLIISYARSADIWWSYIPELSIWNDVRRSAVPAKTETAPIAMFQSAPHDRSGRSAYTIDLMTQLPIDSYGAIFKTRQLPVADNGRQTKLDTIARYKFCLAMENSIAPDYVTEKVYDGLLVGTVPIYLGAPNIDDFLPGERSIIKVTDFSGPAELARYVKALAEDEDAYCEYFAWREKPLLDTFVDLATTRVHPFSRLLHIVRRRVTAHG
jgi:hypothetical protein